VFFESYRKSIERVSLYSHHRLLLVPVVSVSGLVAIRPRRRPAAVFLQPGRSQKSPRNIGPSGCAALFVVSTHWVVPCRRGLRAASGPVVIADCPAKGIAIEIVLDFPARREALDISLNGQDVRRLAAVKHVIE